MEKLRTLDDLKRENFAPVALCVVGSPVAHSLSPEMHNAALQELSKNDARFAGWHYYKFEISPEEIPEALDIFKKKNFRGINFTLPHKQLALPFANTLDENARLIGAANTFTNDGGLWRASNTDGFGLERALETNFGRGFKGASLVIIGAGGAARAAAFYASMRGVESLVIFNRSAGNLNKLCADLAANNFRAEGRILDAALPSDIPGNSIIVNCASVGIKDGDAAVSDFSNIPQSCVFFDMAYRKGSQTQSVIEAQRRGLRAQSGLAMLAWQGAKSLKIWTGGPLLGEFMLDRLQSIL